MNTQELNCFLCVADRLNFTRAAQELYLTTPTVTHHIQKLENELGTELFIRNSKSVRLTPEGEVFYREARDILQRLNALPSKFENIRAHERSVFRIGCTSHQEPLHFISLLGYFRREVPDVQPQFIIDDYYSVMRMLAEKQLDIVLGTRDMLLGFTECKFRKLFMCRSSAIYNKDYFPHNETTVSLKDLSDMRLIVLHQKNVPIQKKDSIEQLLLSRSKEKNYLRQDDAEAVFALAESGYGIGILPKYTFSSKNISEDVQVADIIESAVIEYGMIESIPKNNPIKSKFYDSACEIFNQKV